MLTCVHSFFVLALLFVGLLVPYDDDRLLGANPFIDVNASPFVLAANNAGLTGFDSYLNVVILFSVISIGLSGVYGGSRTLTALAEQGYAPKFFSYIDRAGRPLWSTLFILAFSLLAYVNLAAAGPTVFDWLLALSGLAALFTWGSICKFPPPTRPVFFCALEGNTMTNVLSLNPGLAHIRFRSAWAYHGHTLDEIPFKAIFGVYGSWLGLILVILVLIAQFYTAVWPLGGGVNDAEGFFKSYLALPVVIVFWIGGFIWKREGWLRTKNIDVDSGRREVDWDAIYATRAEKAAMPAWKRMFHILF